MGTGTGTGTGRVCALLYSVTPQTCTGGVRGEMLVGPDNPVFGGGVGAAPAAGSFGSMPAARFDPFGPRSDADVPLRPPAALGFGA